MMLKVIDVFYENALLCVKMGIPVSTIRKQDILQDILKMKYDVPNDQLDLLNRLMERITETYQSIRQKYE